MNKAAPPAISDPYRTALASLREFTRSAADRSPLSILLRAVAVSRSAAKAVLRRELRTKAQRRDAIIAAAAAIAAAQDRKAA